MGIFKNKKNKIENSQKFIVISPFKRYNHTIWWLIMPLFFIGTIIITTIRFTLIGVFIDDIFSLPFGIGRYLLYAFILGYQILFLLGYRMHFSLKAKIVLPILYISILWFLSETIIILQVKDKTLPLWNKNYFQLGMNNYWTFWYRTSVFFGIPDYGLLFFGWPTKFWLLSGGIIGMFCTASTALTSIPVSFILSIIFFLVVFMSAINFLSIFKKNKKKIEKEKLIKTTEDEPILSPEEIKAKEEEETLRKHHHHLENIDIIDEHVFLDDKNFQNDKDVVISNVPHSSKRPETVLEELLRIEDYSPYSKEDFTLEDNEVSNDDYSNDDESDDYSNDEESDDYSNDEESDDYSNDDESDDYSNDEESDDYSNDDESDISLEKNNHSIENELIYHTFKENYKLPHISLLNQNGFDNNINKLNWENANILAKKIINVFNQFNVLASIQSTNVGPQVTKFEIMPDPGTKVKKIIGLEYDLKLALATNSLRIEAPIQGKSFIGLEIPNKKVSIISFLSMLQNISDKHINDKLLIGIGKTVDNKFKYLKLDEQPHLLISGTTGSGKSICIKSIITSLIMRANPKELKLLLIDQKRVELKIFSELPHLICPIIYEHEKALNSLKILTKEMENRYNLFSKYNVNNIDSYNKITNNQLPKIVIVIDELADLMISSKNDIEEYIIRIAQMARASGIHLIIATQRPSTDVVTGLIKTNIPARISFYLNSSIDSRTILDCSGAERLISKGDMLFKGIDSSLARLQGIYILDDEIKRVVNFWKNQQKASFDDKFTITTKKHNDSFNKYNNLSNKNNDPMYEDIKKYVLKNKKASVSLLQRSFSIGYIRASKIIDRLESEKIIGPQNGSKPRSFLYKDKYR